MHAGLNRQGLDEARRRSAAESHRKIGPDLFRRDQRFLDDGNGDVHRRPVEKASGERAEQREDIPPGRGLFRSEEHTSELQSLMRISYAVFCLKKKKILK